MARSRSSARTRPADPPRAALWVAGVMLAVGSLVLTAYVLLQIVWIGILGETLEALDNVNDSLEPWPMVLLAVLALVGAWGMGLLSTWAMATLAPRRPAVTGGVGGLLGLAVGALILRAVGLV